MLALAVPNSTDCSSIARYKQFKAFEKRIAVCTDVFGRGIDIERINIAINYDVPAEADTYLHRVGRAGRFGTKGLGITFVSSPEDEEVLAKIQGRFEVDITELPDEIDQCESILPEVPHTTNHQSIVHDQLNSVLQTNKCATRLKGGDIHARQNRKKCKSKIVSPPFQSIHHFCLWV